MVTLVYPRVSLTIYKQEHHEITGESRRIMELNDGCEMRLPVCKIIARKEINTHNFYKWEP